MPQQVIPCVGVKVGQEPFSGYVYKLYYMDKYIVVKCKTLRRSLEMINWDLSRYFRDTEKGATRNNDYYPFYDFIFENEGGELSLEPLFVSNNPYQLLIHETLAMDEARSDENCLNKRPMVPYIPPKTNQMLCSSWINRGYYLNFRKWYAKHLEKTNPPPDSAKSDC